MNNDLISRSELIRQMGWKLGLGDEENGANVDYMEALEDCKELIDNAPTVEPTTVYEFKGCDNCELERPKGKWKEHKLRNDIVVEYAFKCSNCKQDNGLSYRTDFCPNCGADMRGKEE